VQGAAGIQGISGSGVQGPAGFQGATGNQGFQGAQGSQGFQGSAGLITTIGNTYVAFSNGSQLIGSSNFTFGSSILYVNGQIRATGDVTAYFSSDERLKTKVTKIENAIDKLLAINGVTYNWNEIAKDKDTTVREAGVIAQEVMAVLPEVVIVRDNGYLAVRYDKLTALLIEGVKELATEIKELKKKLGD
jgi:hypothetical protein